MELLPPGRQRADRDAVAGGELAPGQIVAFPQRDGGFDLSAAVEAAGLGGGGCRVRAHARIVTRFGALIQAGLIEQLPSSRCAERCESAAPGGVVGAVCGGGMVAAGSRDPAEEPARQVGDRPDEPANALAAFLADPRIPRHHNDTERHLRYPAVGRNNWMIFTSPGGVGVACRLNSLLPSCHLSGVDSQAHLEDVLGGVAALAHVVGLKAARAGVEILSRVTEERETTAAPGSSHGATGLLPIEVKIANATGVLMNTALRALDNRLEERVLELDTTVESMSRSTR